VEKVAIIDFDVHHGNGTEEIVRHMNQPGKIFFASAHIYDPNFYPGSGACDDLEKNIVNCGIPPMWEVRTERNGNPRGVGLQRGRTLVRYTHTETSAAQV
jgi:hypothetical protein